MSSSGDQAAPSAAGGHSPAPARRPPASVFALRPPPHPVLDQISDTVESMMEDPSSVAASIGVGVIQTLVFVYDFITYPLYYAVQRPWRRVAASKKTRATIVDKTESEVHIKPIFKTCRDLEKFTVSFFALLRMMTSIFDPVTCFPGR